MQVNITIDIQTDTQLYTWIILKFLVHGIFVCDATALCESKHKLNIPFVNILINNVIFVCYLHISPQWARTSSFARFLDNTRHTIVGRTPLDEWSARRRDLYLTTHNTYNRHTSMLPVGFEPTISAGEGPQIYTLYSAATGTGRGFLSDYINCVACACLDVSEEATSSNSQWLNPNFLDS